MQRHGWTLLFHEGFIEQLRKVQAAAVPLSDSEPQQFDGDVLGGAELGGEIMRRGATVTRQHEADGKFHGGIVARYGGDLGDFLARIHGETAAPIKMISIGNLAAGFHRVVIVEMCLRCHRAHLRHFMHGGHIPMLEAS